MVNDIAAHHERTSSPAAIPTGDFAAAWLSRADKLGALDAAISPASGQVLVNADYVSAVRTLLDGAAQSIRVMLFLGTPAEGDALAPGPLRLVESLEERAAAGVSVRLILDQDDGGEPFGSLFINQALVDRLASTAVEVRFDPEDTLLHSKVVVVDDQVAVVGSHNWTRSGFNNTHELSVLYVAPAVAAAFGTRFDSLWASLPVL
ncbi:MAG: hypothetical protein GY698_11835 [Actinomycetia bacterium]|nr:hypothetical protein [Actinomycetes bacterium]